MVDKVTQDYRFIVRDQQFNNFTIPRLTSDVVDMTILGLLPVGATKNRYGNNPSD